MPFPIIVCNYLFPASEEELIRVHSVIYGTAHEGEPVKDHWGLILVPEEDLTSNVQKNCDNYTHEGIGTEENWRDHTEGCSRVHTGKGDGAEK